MTSLERNLNKFALKIMPTLGKKKILVSIHVRYEVRTKALFVGSTSEIENFLMHFNPNAGKKDVNVIA